MATRGGPGNPDHDLFTLFPQCAVFAAYSFDGRFDLIFERFRRLHDRTIPFDLEDIKKTIWLIRRDVRDYCQGDATGFDCWLLTNGTGQYRALTDAGYISSNYPFLHEPADDALPGVRPTLTRFLKAVWRLRPDVHSAFDLSTPEGQQGFIWWFLTCYAPELGLTRVTTAEQRRIMNEQDPRAPADLFLPFTRHMFEVWSRQPELQRIFPLATPAGRNGFLVWYFSTGLARMGLLELLDEDQCRALSSPVPSAPLIPRILVFIWSLDAGLRERFGDLGHASLLPWSRSEGRERYPILRRLSEMTGPPEPKAPAVHRPAVERPFGVNLIGYARGQFGVGEDVRMAALAMQAAGIPFTIFNIQPGNEVCQGDDSVETLITDRRPYAINLLCATGVETARLAVTEGSALFDGRRTIGYWPWELPEWPEEWRHAYALVDEVWASSRYTYDAYLKSSPKPVRHLPMAVAVEATAGLDRRSFGLPEGRFLFIFSFDVLSSLARKNPLACLRAFRQAFPLGSEPVGLVVKAMRATPDIPVWRTLLEEAGADPRVTIINRTLGRAEVLDLYRACDGFVSLHRAEGFGRGIAETMMLGKPVIVTGHSGNMDFTTSETAALVNHSLRPVAPGDYPFGEGQLWADPDIGHAAWWMRRLFEDRKVREDIARRGRLLVTATYAPKVVGAGYAAVLALPLFN